MNGNIRPEYIHQLGEVGCGIPTSEEYGGLGMGYFEYALALKRLQNFSILRSVCSSKWLATGDFARVWDSEQKDDLDTTSCAGEAIGGFSEPDSGSDAASLQTTAVRDGDKYILNGRKFWITHGGYADVYIVMARTGNAGARGVSAFIVSKDTPGLSFGKKEENMGLRASPTADMLLEMQEFPQPI